MKKAVFTLFVFVVMLSSTCFSQVGGSVITAPTRKKADEAKIGGISLVAPVNKTDDKWVPPVTRINAGWVALLPYGYSYSNKPRVVYNMSRQWWGEQIEGTRATTRHAKKYGLSVMLKPMVWIPGSWPGSFDMATEVLWKEWEVSYTKYIMDFARLAQDEKVDLFCVGTEYKLAATKRPDFWRKLIKDVRSVYKGKVTYAANWDNYENVRFWDAVDYIGIDAYFPLSYKVVPNVNELVSKWQVPSNGLQKIALRYGKQILFTEFGYRSTDRTAWQQWELEHIPNDEGVNLQGQVNAYEGFFKYFWDKKWFAGVFLWQWYHFNDKAGGKKNSDYTPQNKPAQKVITEWFGK